MRLTAYSLLIILLIITTSLIAWLEGYKTGHFSGVFDAYFKQIDVEEYLKNFK